MIDTSAEGHDFDNSHQIDLGFGKHHAPDNIKECHNLRIEGKRNGDMLYTIIITQMRF